MQCAGNDGSGDCLLPMLADGRSIGHQRFHLLTQETALGVTTYSDNHSLNRIELQKLLSASPLRQLHWVNITHGHVQLSTIKNDRKI